MRPDAGSFDKNEAAPGILFKGARFNIYERHTTPPEGGIYVFYKGMIHPKKGFPYPEAVMANNSLKRTVKASVSFISKETMPSIALFALLPWKLKMRAVKRIAEAYADLADKIFETHYLRPERYCKAAKEIWRGTAIFMNTLGFDPTLSDRCGRALATILEYDDSYRFYVQDLAGETTGETLSRLPIGEIRRLGQIFYDRDGEFEIIGSRRVGTMVRRFMRIAAFAFVHPKMRRALKVALGAVDFNRLRLDEADKYHVLMRNNYHFWGEPFQSRRDRYHAMHGFVPDGDSYRPGRPDAAMPPEAVLTEI